MLLILVLAGVATTPFWTPFVTPLLPWNRYQAGREQAMTARLDALDQENAAAHTEIARLQSAQDALSRRLGESTAALAGLKTQLAGLGQRLDAPAAQPAALADLKAKIAGLGQRLDALAAQPAAPAGIEAQLAGLSHRLDTVAAQAAALAGLKAQLAGLDRRLDTVAAQPAADPAVTQKLQQDVASLDKRAGDLAHRVASVEARMAAKTRADDRQTALLLALLQMREGVEAAEPFTVSYDAFATLAKDRPRLVAAAQPLMPLAESGVASRATLARDLARLADRIATARPAVPADDWRDRVLDQLRGLVTVRHLDGSERTSPEAAVDRAEADLASGDLAAAVTALQALSGPPAAVAQPWLAAARRRLKAETALSRLQRMLAAPESQPKAGSQPEAAPAFTAPPAAAPAQPAPAPGARPADHSPAPAPAEVRSRP